MTKKYRHYAACKNFFLIQLSNSREEELLGKGIAITDDAMVVELLLGKRVKLIEGSYHNIKLTTPEDLKIAEALLDT